MKRTVLLVVNMLIILSIASSVYAKFWGWEIVTTYLTHRYTPWKYVTPPISNYSLDPMTVTRTKTVTASASINASVSIKSLVEAEVGFSASYSKSETISISVVVRPGYTLYWEARWSYIFYSGKATYYTFWVPVKTETWSAKKPINIYERVRTVP